MKALTGAKFLITLASIFLANPVNSLHLDVQTVNTTENDGVTARNNSAVTTKGNISVLIPDPTSITNQLQSKLQSLLSSLNSTSTQLTSKFNSLLNSFSKNVTSSFKPKGEFRIDELIQNVTAILRNSTESLQSESSNSSVVNSVNSEMVEALQEFERSMLQLRDNITSGSSNQSLPTLEKRIGNENTEGNVNVRERRPSRKLNGFRRMWDQLSSFRSQMDSSLHESVLRAQTRLQDSVTSVARQGSHVMRNQTMGFMNEVQRVFSSFSEPFRRFFEGMRKRLPTSVVSA